MNCKHCLGMGKIIINAGTGLLATCVKCALPKPSTVTHQVLDCHLTTNTVTVTLSNAQ